jgi:hypothetical protein
MEPDLTEAFPTGFGLCSHARRLLRARRHPSGSHARRASRSCRVGLAALACAAALLLAPAGAVAEVTEAKGTDPVGDSLGAPSQDIVSARVQYDSSGQITVSATMNGAIASGPQTFLSFAVASFSPPATCAGTTVSLSGYASGGAAQVTITGVKGTGTAFRFVFGSTISFTTYRENQQLANKAFSCMTLSVSGSEGGQVLDQLNTLLLFNLGSSPPPAAPVPAPSPPSLAGLSSTVKVKKSKGTGAATASCSLPSAEACTVSLTLYAILKHGHATARVKVGTVTGRIAGGKKGKLALKLNAAGRRYLMRGSFHVEAKGTVRSSAGLVTNFNRRLAIKKTK